MLDSCSTGTFLPEDIAACLDAKGTNTKLMVKTVNGTQLHDTKALNGLSVTDLNGENRIDFPKTFTKEDISAIEVDVPAPQLAHNCNRIAVVEVGSEKPLDHHFAVQDKVKEIVTPQALIRMFELDFPERSDESAHQYSQEDKRFLEIGNKGIRRTDDGHYEIPLPFRSKDVHLPDNKEQVFQRACWLKRKLARNKKFHEDYVNFMNDIIRKGFARKVTPDRVPARSGQV